MKNTLATVQAIMGSTARSAETIEDFKTALIGRIGALAKTHLLLSDEGRTAISFEQILRNELDAFDDGSDDRVRFSGPPVEVSSRLAVALGMAIHELTTNAAKFGALSVYGGKVDIAWSVTHRSQAPRAAIRLGGERRPAGQDADREGFGTRAARLRAAGADSREDQDRISRRRRAHPTSRCRCRRRRKASKREGTLPARAPITTRRDTMAYLHVLLGAQGAGVQPAVRHIGLADLKDALRKGLADFYAMPTHALFLCAIYPVVGLLLARLAFGYSVLPLLYPMATGFALIGPVAALGLYELSRRREAGREVSAGHALDVLSSSSIGAIVALGLLLLAIFVVWWRSPMRSTSPISATRRRPRSAVRGPMC